MSSCCCGCLKDVLEEGTLSYETIEREFETLAVMNATRTSGIDFDAFCILMERLEELWQELYEVNKKTGNNNNKNKNKKKETNEITFFPSSPPKMLSVVENIDQTPPARTRMMASDQTEFVIDIENDEDDNADDEGDDDEKSDLDTIENRVAICGTNDIPRYTSKEHDVAKKLQQVELLAAECKALLCDTQRHKVAEEAALSGLALSTKQSKLQREQEESQNEQIRKEAYLSKIQEIKYQEKYQQQLCQELFKAWKMKASHAEKLQIQEEVINSQRKMIEFETKRTNVLWKVLLECEKYHITPLECRDLSRLYLHLKRVTTA